LQSFPGIQVVHYGVTVTRSRAYSIIDTPHIH
jgi:hypothetical protein